MISIKYKNISIFYLLFVFLLPNLSNADEIKSSAGFSVEPAISHISVGKGMVFRSSLSMRNQGDVPISFSINVKDFEALNDEGGVKIIDTKQDKYDQIYASGWFSFPKEKLVIPPRQKLLVPYSILVPDDASNGGRSVVFEIESIDGNVHSKIDALCFLTVPGDAKESLIFNDFSISSFVSSKASNTFHIELKNTGQTHVRPDGSITVRNMFGSVRGKYYFKDNNELGTIIPTAKRSIDYVWSGEMNLLDFGLWNAKIDLTYGVNNEHSISDRLFFLVLPWKAILYIIIIIGGSIYFFTRSIRILRKNVADIKETEDTNLEKSISFKLLIIPFIAGLLLLIVVVTSMYSVLEQKEGGGSIQKVQLYKK